MSTYYTTTHISISGVRETGAWGVTPLCLPGCVYICEQRTRMYMKNGATARRETSAGVKNIVLLNIEQTRGYVQAKRKTDRQTSVLL